MKLDSETARDIAYRSADPAVYGHVAEEFTGTTRWGVVYRTIFIHQGKYYALEWEQGATELQEDEFTERSEFEAYEVKPVRVTVTEYHKP
jgi:hypothetical protein